VLRIVVRDCAPVRSSWQRIQATSVPIILHRKDDVAGAQSASFRAYSERLASMRSDNVAARSVTKNAGRDVGLRIDINIHCSVIDIIPGLTIALDNENTRLLGL